MFASLEPFGEGAAFWRSGVIAATIANVNRAKGKPAFKPSDFMPRTDSDEKSSGRQSPEQMAEIMRSVLHGMPTRKPGEPRITRERLKQYWEEKRAKGQQPDR